MKIEYINILTGGDIIYKCDEDFFECQKDTLNFGLCMPKSKPDKCNDMNYDLNSEIRIPQPDKDKLNSEERKYLDELKKKGLAKGYIEKNLTNSCYKQNNNPIIFEYNFIIPTNFSIATINAMGIYRGNNIDLFNLIDLRMKMLGNQLAEYNPTIICFQEMSEVSFDLLYTPQIRKLYPFFYEHNLSELKTSRNKDIEVFVLSKIPIKKVTIYPLEGNLDYTNSLGVYEFDNLIIINVYMQAGSSSSPGQQFKSLHYSRCRSQQLHFIKSIIDNNSTKPYIILGDFNFDLNTTDTNHYPEKAQLDQLEFIDTWTHGTDTSGLTENTDINTLRWNSKFEEKKFRYDAIFYKGNNIGSIKCSEVIFNIPKSLEGEENRWYESTILSKPENRVGQKIRYNKEGSVENPIYDLFISDHFGVFAEFILK